MARILVIDDEATVRRLLITILARLGHEAVAADSFAAGRQQLEERSFALVFLDIYLPDGNGLELLPEIRQGVEPPEVIIISGMGDAEAAACAIRNGAWSFLEKPLRASVIELQVSRVLEFRQLALAARHQPIMLDRQGIIGTSDALTHCLDQVARAARTDGTVLLVGASGSGKELIATTIHANSQRKDGPFVVVDCAALPETLLESLLFGHVKGAFTGADRDRLGLIEQADGGILFLDEVGELPLGAQKSFLRVLQERKFRPIGGSAGRSSDFRLLAATNRDLAQMVATGSFREDLFFRLRGMTITVPSLRERREDIEPLLCFAIRRFCDRNNLERKGYGPEFLAALQAYPWPGNVRELFQVTEESLTRALDLPTLFPHHLPDRIRIAATVAGMEQKRAPLEAVKELPTWREYKNLSEQEYLLRLLARSGGTMTTACRLAGLSRARLYQLLAKYQISRDQ